MRKTESRPEFRRIQNERDTLYYAAGIPSTAWSTPRAAPKFSPIMGDEDDPELKVGVQLQEEWFPKVIDGRMFEDPYLIYMSCIGSDELACRYGYEIMKKALAADLRVQITNAARIDKEETDGETVFMLHNVFKDANQYRMQCVRDWITVHEDCFRLVVITGICPYEFSKKIAVNPHAMFLLETPASKNKGLPKKINRA